MPYLFIQGCRFITINFIGRRRIQSGGSETFSHSRPRASNWDCQTSVLRKGVPGVRLGRNAAARFNAAETAAALASGLCHVRGVLLRE